jgi:hypothetical protein
MIMMQGMAEKGMSVKGIFLFISLVLLLSLSSCTSRSGGSIKDQGGTIVLSSDDQVMTATRGNTLEETLVVLGVEPVLDPEAMAYIDGRIAAVRPEDAGSLLLGGNSVQHLTLVASNRLTQKQIRALTDMISRKSHPLISVSLTELQVTELTFRDAKVYLSGEVQRQYLVNKISIVRENYL